jgi:hypothetical protein
MAGASTAHHSSVDLQEIIRRLNPNRPAGQDPSAIPRVERDSNAVRQLRAHVSADPLAKVLLTGHIGVGKSTELLHLADQMEQERFVVRCAVAQTLGGHNVNTFTLLVVILEACIRIWIERLGEMPRGLVEELVNHVRALLPHGKRPARQPKTRLERVRAAHEAGAQQGPNPSAHRRKERERDD